MGVTEEFLHVLTSGDATLRFAKKHYRDKKPIYWQIRLLAII